MSWAAAVQDAKAAVACCVSRSWGASGFQSWRSGRAALSGHVGSSGAGQRCCATSSCSVGRSCSGATVAGAGRRVTARPGPASAGTELFAVHSTWTADEAEMWVVRTCSFVDHGQTVTRQKLESWTVACGKTWVGKVVWASRRPSFLMCLRMYTR